MQLYYPVSRRPFPITQHFGQNANSYYKEMGLPGHTGTDIYCDFNESIYATIDCEVFSVLNKDNPDLMRYRAVYTLVEASGRYYEISYGHANHIYVNVGDVVKAGHIIMSGGNTGDVATGGTKVTRKMKEAGSKLGTHLHFQIREVRPVILKSPGKKYLMNSKGYFKKDGMYMEILNYDNGYLGCIDPEQFFTGQYALDLPQTKDEEIYNFLEKPAEFGYEWKHNLVRGQYNDDIKYLQVALMIRKFLPLIPLVELGHYGRKTAMAVLKYQQSKRIYPTALNNVGPKTRRALNEEFLKLPG